MTNNIKNFKLKITRLVSGFTLIETLVAVLLLATAIAGPITIASKGLSAALVARDQMTAFFLAQDGVEYVRYVRDSNKLAGDPWLNTLAPCMTASGCTLEPATATVTACPVDGCPVINRYDNAGQVIFTYTSGTPTPQQFVRTVKLTSPPTGELTEEVLTVTVSWRAQSGVTRSVSVRENLFDWQ